MGKETSNAVWYYLYSHHASALLSPLSRPKPGRHSKATIHTGRLGFSFHKSQRNFCRSWLQLRNPCLPVKHSGECCAREFAWDIFARHAVARNWSVEKKQSIHEFHRDFHSSRAGDFAISKFTPKNSVRPENVKKT